MAKILIVEDNLEIQECYTEMFIPQGYQVITATSGEQALVKVERYQPNIMILDLSLAGMDGRSLLIELKKSSPYIPVIIVSDRQGMMNDPEIRLSRQVKHFFDKPVDLPTLSQAVQECLGESTSTMSLFHHVLRDYKVQECISSSNNGDVYKGEKDGTTVIIKLFSNRQGVDEEKIARFQRESRLLEKVNHENIIELFDVGSADEGKTSYIVMEYFPGETIEKLIHSEDYLPWQEATHIIKEVAKGMQAAHEMELIHRDLKPSNILYHRPSQKIKIIDFGIAKELLGDQITKTGEVLGTPFYMSPEQCVGRDVDHRTDIYSLGAMFFEMLTGIPPFQGETPLNTMMAHLLHEPKWSSASEINVPDKIKKVVEKMLAKSAKNRHKDMNEVIESLTSS